MSRLLVSTILIMSILGCDETPSSITNIYQGNCSQANVGGTTVQTSGCDDSLLSGEINFRCKPDNCINSSCSAVTGEWDDGGSYSVCLSEGNARACSPVQKTNVPFDAEHNAIGERTVTVTLESSGRVIATCDHTVKTQT